MAIALALRDRALVETAYAAGLRISELAAADLRLARPAPRRDPGASARAARSASGCSGGRRSRALTRYLDRRPPDRPRSASRRAGRRRRPSEVFLNHRGAPLGVRGLRYRLDRLCRARRPAGRRLAAHASPLVRDPPARRRRGPARRPGAARPREPGHDPDLHARLAGPPARRATATRIRGARREDGDREHASSDPGPGRDHRLGRVPGLARARLGPARGHRQRVRRRIRTSSTRSSPRSASPT